MPLNIGELVAYVKVDHSAVGQNIRAAQAQMRAEMTRMQQLAATQGESIGKAAGSKISESFKASVKDLGKGLLGAFAVERAVAGLKSLASQASDLNETTNLTGVVFGKNAKAMEDWARTSDRTLGLSQQQALESAGAFGDMFSQLEFGGDQAAAMSRQVLQLAADLGSFKNLRTEDVVERLSAAFRGEYDSLQALIPNISAARVEQEAMAETGKSSATQLTAQEKATATLAIVTKDGKNAIGDFARTQDGAANASKISAAEAANLRAELGQKLLPAYTALILFGRDQVLPFLSSVVNGFEEAADATEPLTDGIGDVVKTFQQMPAPVQSSTVALLAFLALRSRVEGVGTALGSKVTSSARSASSALDTVRLNMMYAGDAARGTENRLVGVTKAIGAAGGAGLRGAASGLLTMLGGPWGAAFAGAVAGVTLFITQHEKAKQEVQDLTAAIEADSGALGKNTRERVKNALETSGVLRAAADLGLDLQKVTDAALDQADAQKYVNDELERLASLQKDPGLNLSKYGDLVGQRRDMEKVREGILGRNDAVRDAIGQSKRLAAADGEATDKIGALDAATKNSTDSTRDYTDEVTDAAKAVLEFADAQLKASGAQVSYQDALANVDERLAKRKELEAELRKTTDKDDRARIKKDLEDYALTLDVTTKAGRENKKALDDQAETARGQAEANLAAGKSYEEVRRQMADARKDFIANAEKFGLNEKAAKKLADQYGLTRKDVDAFAESLGLVPHDVITSVKTKGITAARNGVALLKQELKELDGTVVIRVQRLVTDTDGKSSGGGKITAGGQVAFNADGGYYPASQGARLFTPSDGMKYVFNEPETGGESFIPHAPGKRRQALKVLDQTADLFGLTLAPKSVTNDNRQSVRIDRIVAQDVADFERQMSVKARLTALSGQDG
ncbi:hypothetical protein [Knoellia koreensis]|uniref:Uncharacterized protein n=1 Tax=Knoellia koreensis TaxID=2730921 RepID=A0A849HB12_9MICO|nr:hypothetical protein [Knoellia sp. DB2414S]NNM44598.1 hypothetical protein [Knoellia sp. DB2414S]